MIMEETLIWCLCIINHNWLSYSPVIMQIGQYVIKLFCGGQILCSLPFVDSKDR